MSGRLRLIARIAPFGLVTVITLLTGFGLWSAAASYALADSANRAVRISDTYQQIRYDVTLESALQQEYTRQTLHQQQGGPPPDPSRVLLLDQAAANVGSMLAGMLNDGIPQDQAVASRVLTEHDRYLRDLERVQEAVFRRDSKGAGLLLDTVLLPLADRIASQVNDITVQEHRQALISLRQVRTQAELTRTMTVIVFGVGLLLLFLFWWVLQAFSTRVEREESAVRLSEERYATLLEISPDGVMLVDPHGSIRMANRRAAELYGYASQDDLINLDGLALVSIEDRTRLRMHIHARISSEDTNRSDTDYRLLKLDGSTFPAEVSSSAVVDEAGLPMGVLLVIRDVTERKRAEIALKHQATHDALTGLPNRVLLRERVERALVTTQQGKHSVALLIMDLNRFKEVNDSLGHPCGDLLLREAAGRIRDAVRDTDTVARLGGDEFAVVMPATDEIGAQVAIRKIEDILREPFKVEGHRLDISASIGAAISSGKAGDAASLMRHADVAMYAAKRTGAAHCIYSRELDLDNSARLALLADLRQAISEGQFVLHYQAKHDLHSGRIVQVEALVRWLHPEHGLILPGEFIPLAEQNGLIESLTTWVLREALSQCRQWLDAGLDISVAVNLSAGNLHQQQYVDTIVRLLEETHVPPSRLSVEVTEGALMADPEGALRVLRQLHDMGIRIAVDDFGTGHSSLAYLKLLPVDEIKIDRSFVLDMVGSGMVIVRSIIDLGVNLGLDVTAEGVGDQETCDLLLQMGCFRAQGFYLGRPLPAEHMRSYLARFDSTPVNSSKQPAGVLIGGDNRA